MWIGGCDPGVQLVSGCCLTHGVTSSQLESAREEYDILKVVQAQQIEAYKQSVSNAEKVGTYQLVTRAPLTGLLPPATSRGGAECAGHGGGA